MLLLLLLPLQTTSSPLEQERSIRSVLNVPDPANNFTHIAVYDQDTIFLGGTNYIYRVSTGNLSIEKLEKIGPNPSNSIGQDCYNDNSCDKNVNNTKVKVLLIYKNKAENISELIICTSLDNGTCEKRHPTTLAVNIRKEHVVSVTDSNVAFLAPGPSKNRSSPTPFLYLASSLRVPSSTGPTQTVPLFCSRNITTFGIVSGKSYVAQTYTNSFHIQYIYGFSSGIYSYVISIQRSGNPGIDEYITKLHRVCQFDKKLNSYAETPISCCYEKNQLLINVPKIKLQAAYVGKPGRFFANSITTSPEDDVLFGMFDPGATGNFGNESVLGTFSMSVVESSFTFNTKRCFSGTASTGPAYLTDPQPCIPSVRILPSYNFPIILYDIKLHQSLL